MNLLKAQWYAQWSLYWQPNDAHSSISNKIHKKQKSFKQILNKTYCD